MQETAFKTFERMDWGSKEIDDDTECGERRRRWWWLFGRDGMDGESVQSLRASSVRLWLRPQLRLATCETRKSQSTTSTDANIIQVPNSS